MTVDFDGIRWLSIVLFGVACLVSSPSARAADDAEAAFVLEVKGDWLLDGKPGKKIKGGDKLVAGAKFVPVKTGSEISITVCFYTGKAETFFKAGEVPVGEGDSFFTRLASTVRGNYRSGVIHAISRDGLIDGIVPLADGKLVLTPIASGLPAASYLLQWTPHVDDPKQQPKPILLPVDWDPESREPVSAASITEGIYRVCIVDRRSKKPTGPGEVLVAVCVGEGYAAQQKFYEEVVKRIETDWDAASRAKAGVEFRRACLKSIASLSPEDGAGKKK